MFSGWVPRAAFASTAIALCVAGGGARAIGAAGPLEGGCRGEDGQALDAGDALAPDTGGPDAHPNDATADARDTGVDARVDGGVDARADAPHDATADADAGCASGVLCS